MSYTPILEMSMLPQRNFSINNIVFYIWFCCSCIKGTGCLFVCLSICVPKDLANRCTEPIRLQCFSCIQ